MKKLFAALLCLSLALCALSPALASEGDTILLEEMGTYLPRGFRIDTQYGFSYVSQDGVLSHEPFIASLEFSYFMMPAEEVQALLSNPSPTQEELDRVNHLWATYGAFVVSDASVLDVTSILLEKSSFDLPADSAVEFDTVDGYHFYFFSLGSSRLGETLDQFYAKSDERFTDEQIAQWTAEADAAAAQCLDALKACARTAPFDPGSASIGQVLQFETIDLDGNPVSSDTLFAENQITMVNLWGTWCPNCMNEMEELAQMHLRLKDKGCGIVGVDWERGENTEQSRANAKAALASFGVTYPNVVYPENHALLDQLSSPGFPTTVFVDSQGKILTYPIAGALVWEYEPTLDKLLSGEAVTPQLQGTGTSSNAEGAYRVFVFDADGPVQGVVIQFCSDTICSMGKTDENGMVSFDQPEGEYTVHVLKVPAGYEPVKGEYHPLTTFSDVTIFLTKE